MANSLTGTRIREERRARGVRQTALAQQAGISASYLNLIEHNKRNVSPKVLAAVARALRMDPADLGDQTESALASELRHAATELASEGPEMDQLDELIRRFPGWAQLVATQMRQMRDQAAAISTLADRLNFDPHLQQTLHEMLTGITAIRSTAGILATERDIPGPQQDQFQGTIHEESLRLSEAATELVEYLDRTEESASPAATPQEAFEQFMERHHHVFTALETDHDDSAIDGILAQEPTLASADALERARVRLEIYRADALAMPLVAFFELGKRCGFSPDRLADEFGVSVLAAFRRLSTLARADLDAPRFGLVVINAAGQPLYRRPLPGFSLPRFASICALWPVFQSLSVPERRLETRLVMPDGSEFLARSVAQPVMQGSFGDAPHYAAGMLVCDWNDALRWGMITATESVPAQAVGTSCRLCQRSICATRSEPSLLPLKA